MNDATTQPPISVLVIDDEPQIQRLLTITLEADGYRVTSASSGKQGVLQAAQHRYDVVFLDLGLPDASGLSVLKQLREWTQVPVIVLTVQDAESDKIEALDSGADDYVTKPFNVGELLARLRAALRRTSRGRSDEPVFQAGPLTVDL